jgi:DNA-binding CsgD family transcriptional regulator
MLMSDLAFAFEYPFVFSESARTRAATDDAPPQTAEPTFGLSAYDLALLRCASNGMVDKSIANALKQDAASVHQQWRRIRRNLEANDRSHAVAIALSLGLIPAPDRTLVLAARHHMR